MKNVRIVAIEVVLIWNQHQKHADRNASKDAAAEKEKHLTITMSVFQFAYVHAFTKD